MTKKLKEVKLLVLQSFLQFNIILMKIKSNISNRQCLNLDRTITLYKGSIAFKLQWKKNFIKKINLNNFNRDKTIWELNLNLQVNFRAENQEVLLKEALQSYLKAKLKEELRQQEKPKITKKALFKEWALLKLNILNYWKNKISSEIPRLKHNIHIPLLNQNLNNLNKKMISMSAI